MEIEWTAKKFKVGDTVKIISFDKYCYIHSQHSFSSVESVKDMCGKSYKIMEKDSSGYTIDSYDYNYNWRDCEFEDISRKKVELIMKDLE